MLRSDLAAARSVGLDERQRRKRELAVELGAEDDDVGNYLDGLIDLTGTCGGGQADVDQDGDIDENDYNLLYDVGVGVGP